VNEYCEGALEYLERAWDPERALFSFSTVLRDGAIVNDFEHPQCVRYTINTLLGLAEAERHGGDVGWLGGVAHWTRTFADRHFGRLEHSDHGLLLVLLAAVDPRSATVRASLEHIERTLARKDVARRVNMQDLAWMLWGLCATRDPAADAPAHRIFDLIRTRFVNARTGLPRHSVARYRRNIVSFGSLVYFLRAMHEYGERFGDARARSMFATGVERALALQGPDGEWPWMIDIRSGVPFDLYPVFTVHQDSMAMLWLFPAERLGLPGAAAAIDRSFRWNLGQNEIGETLVRDEPCFWVYRSIERDEGQPRLRRYLRALGPPPRAYPARAQRVRINRECRSYHLGWVLYTWASRAATPAPGDDRSEVTA
jgi:hypothetical protein